jgi:hypothetical protein
MVWHSMKKLILAGVLVLSASSFFASAQTDPEILKQRLCKTWALVSEGSTSPEDFIMIIHPDHTVQQGMLPNGLIPGRWKAEAAEMILTITDETTDQVFTMKIVSLTPDELLLQERESSALIRYRAK